MAIRSLIKNKTQTTVINMVNQLMLVINLTFRMLSNTHFQKLNRYNLCRVTTVYIVLIGVSPEIKKNDLNN